MPAFEATVSEITEPTNAEEIATLSEAKKSGIVRGTPTLRKICQREAPSDAQDVAQLALQRGQAHRHVDGDGKERQQERGEHGRHVADAEPHDEQRHDRRLRDAVEADQQRIERVVHGRKGADAKPERETERHRGDEADERGHERVRGRERRSAPRSAPSSRRRRSAGAARSAGCPAAAPRPPRRRAGPGTPRRAARCGGPARRSCRRLAGGPDLLAHEPDQLGRGGAVDVGQRRGAAAASPRGRGRCGPARSTSRRSCRRGTRPRAGRGSPARP